MGGKGSGNFTKERQFNSGNQMLIDKANHVKEKQVYLNNLVKRKYNYPDYIKAFELICDYIQDRKEQDEPITVSGMILASGFGRATFYEILNGDKDITLGEYIEQYQIDTNKIYLEDNGLSYGYNEVLNCKIIIAPPSDLFKKCYLKLQEETEERLYKSGKVGDIFALKSLHGWRDGEEQASARTVNQTLVIADSKQAEEAIKLLK